MMEAIILTKEKQLLLILAATSFDWRKKYPAFEEKFLIIRILFVILRADWAV